MWSTYFLSAQQSIVQTLGENEEYFISSFEILEDKNSVWNIKQVSAPEFASKFQLHQGKKSSIAGNDNTASAYWIKITLNDASPRHKSWLLEAYDFKIDSLSIFLPDSTGQYSELKTGDNFTFNNKTFQHKNLEFLLPDFKSQTLVCYLRVKSDDSIRFIFVARSFERFVNYALGEYYFFGIFYGILIIIILLNSFLFFTLKDFTYIFYVFYVISLAVYLLVDSGLAFQYLWPNIPSINNYTRPFAALCVVITAMLYAKSFLVPRLTSPRIRIILYTVIAIRVGIFLVRLIFDRASLMDPQLDVMALLIAYLAGIYGWYIGFKPARFYVLAFSFVFIGFLVTSLNNLGIIQTSSIVVVYALNFAVVLEVITLSLALADRMNTFKRDKELEQREKINQLIKNESLQQEIIVQLKENEALKDKVNQELEAKVKERTLELEAANEEIRRMNEVLHADNIKLESNVKDLSKARVMQKIVSFEEFQNIYSDENSCLEFLSNMKWAKGYRCEKCQNTNYSNGPIPYSRRCSKCSYIESATANTLFYRLKFPIVKAFYMVFLISNRTEITADELSEKLSLRRQTCWAFKRKVLEAMEQKKRPKADPDGWSYLVLGHIEDKPTKKSKIE
ncbi:MAG: hypothetical protein MUF42_01245 [Cytophagaceae bacterium]|jgi:hypothetical protein|nr:hypothetical protein [Cytophagaceae bacterium]